MRLSSWFVRVAVFLLLSSFGHNSANAETGISAFEAGEVTLSDLLGRSVRPLWKGIPFDLIDEVRELSEGDKIDLSFESNDFFDFDVYVIFADDLFEVQEDRLAKSMGFSVDEEAMEVFSEGFLVVLTKFEGEDSNYPLVVVRRRVFYSVSLDCQAALLARVFLFHAWEAVDSKFKTERFFDC